MTAALPAPEPTPQMLVQPAQLLRLPAKADPRAHALLAYWRRMAAGRAMPCRSDIDPLDIPDLLPHLTLVDVREAEPRFVYRLVGTAAVALMKQDLTGRPVGTGVKPSELAAVLARYRRVAEEGVAIFQHTPLQEDANDHSWVNRLMLPLASATDGRPAMILSLLVAAGQT